MWQCDTLNRSTTIPPQWSIHSKTSSQAGAQDYRVKDLHLRGMNHVLRTQ